MKWNPLSWLIGRVIRAESSKWTTAGIIHAEQEQRIGDQYDQECCGLAVADCAKLTLFGLAAVAMVLALMLVTDVHWQQIHFALKVSLVLLCMAVAHGTGYWYRFQMNATRRGDACFLVGTILYGVALLLVSEQVHVPELYPWAFFAWAAGTLPLAWVLGSCSMLALANVLATVWVVWHILVSGEPAYTLLFVFQGLCLIRWSDANRARGLFVMSLLSLILWWCMLTVAEGLGHEGFFWIATLGPLLMLIGLRHDESHPFASIYKTAGMSLSILVLLVLSLPSVSADLMGISHAPREMISLPAQSTFVLWFWLCAIAGTGVVLWLVPAPRRLNIRREWPVLAALAGVTLLPVALGLVGLRIAAIVLPAIFNAAAVAVVVGSVICGASKNCSSCVALGIVYFAAWVVLLICDLSLSGNLTTAALIFAVAAAAILVTVRFWSKKQASSNETVSAENT